VPEGTDTSRTGENPSDAASYQSSTRPIRKLSVVVPVFNERNTLVEILRRMRQVTLPEGIDREIIVIDDGSTDGTREVLKQLADSTVRIAVHQQNRGKGAAVRTGFEHAVGDYVLVQDADLEYDPEDWPKLLNPVLRGKARVVYGSRFTGERRNMLFLHWVGNRFLSLLTNVLYNTTLSDMETCYKLIDRTLLADLHLRAEKFDIEPEITAKLLKRKIRIYEVPISYTGREFDEGKKITWRDGFSAVATLVKYRFTD
jgi:glycosyltransferase involved in cell wall biosynthesis